MDPFTILLLAKIAAATAVQIAIAYLTIVQIRDYLRKKREKNIGEDAVLMKKQLESEDVIVIAGFIDGKDKDIKDMRVWKADRVDPSLKSLPDRKVVIVR
jgi:hypothetical protein